MDVDSEIASTLAPYHMTLAAYLALGLGPPLPLPPGTMDTHKYLERMAELQALNEEGQADVERQIWELMFGVRPVDGEAFRGKMGRLLRAKGLTVF